MLRTLVRLAGAPAPARGFLVGIVLQRNPVILPDPTPEEVAYEKFSQQISTEKAKAFNSNFFYKKSDSKSIEQQQQAQDAQEAELYKAGSRETEADRANDQRSLERKLARTLYLVTQNAESKEWGFPQMTPPADHLLNEACQQHIETVLGEKRPRAFVPGYFPQAVHEGAPAPTFFYCAQLIHGAATIARRTDLADYKWLDREEVLALLDARLAKSVAPILFQ